MPRQKEVAITPSKAARKPPKDSVALPASPVKGTALFPPFVAPVALGAADADVPVVAGTWEDPVPVGYGGADLLTAAKDEATASVERAVLGEVDRLWKVVMPGYTAATQDTETTF